QVSGSAWAECPNGVESANSDSAITPDDFHYLLDRGVAADCRQSSRTHLMPTCVVLSLFCRASAINLSP
uniref:hypothetical protein n=1 Tax=Pseudomonas aeruginosa TaxID=287 RepID=UPI001C4A5286